MRLFCLSTRFVAEGAQGLRSTGRRVDDLECAGRKHQILPDLTPAFQASSPLVPFRSGGTSPRRRVLSPGARAVSLRSHFISQGLSFLGQKTKPWDCRLSEPLLGSPGGSPVKNRPAKAGDVGLILGSGSSPGGRNGNPLRYCCLENSMDRGA